MLFMIFFFDIRLGVLICIPVILSFSFVGKMVGKGMYDDMKKYQDSMEEMNDVAVEYVRGMPVVKTFNQTIFSFKKFTNAIKNYSNFCIQYTKKTRMPMLMFLLFLNSIFAVLVITTLLIHKLNLINNKYIFDLMFYIIFTPIFATTLNKIIYLGESSLTLKDALDRINSILSIEKEKTFDNITVINNYNIDVENISFSYDKNMNVINDVSMHIKENELVALVGASGSGKSTIASLLSRFYDVDKGCIKIGGVDIRNIDIEKFSNIVSFVFQENKLFKGSIYDNMKMANKNATDEMIYNALKLSSSDEIISKLSNGINTIYGSKGVYLSGGEMQRLCIARAILKNSKVVIFDEATAYMDVENEEKIKKAFENLAKNKTVIMIAHRLSTVANADNIFVFDSGKIIESGTHQKLLSNNGAYFKMYNEYQKSIKWEIKN